MTQLDDQKLRVWKGHCVCRQCKLIKGIWKEILSQKILLILDIIQFSRIIKKKCIKNLSFLGGFPYPTVSNHELLAYLACGQRLQRPENCSEHLYELMLHCWADNPEDRPEFTDIVQKLEPSHQKIYVDFNDLSSDYVFPPTIEQIQNNNIKSGVKLKTFNGLKAVWWQDISRYTQLPTHQEQIKYWAAFIVK